MADAKPEAADFFEFGGQHLAPTSPVPGAS